MNRKQKWKSAAMMGLCMGTILLAGCGPSGTVSVQKENTAIPVETVAEGARIHQSEAKNRTYWKYFEDEKWKKEIIPADEWFDSNGKIQRPKGFAPRLTPNDDNAMVKFQIPYEVLERMDTQQILHVILDDSQPLCPFVSYNHLEEVVSTARDYMNYIDEFVMRDDAKEVLDKRYAEFPEKEREYTWENRWELEDSWKHFKILGVEMLQFAVQYKQQSEFDEAGNYIQHYHDGDPEEYMDFIMKVEVEQELGVDYVEASKEKFPDQVKCDFYDEEEGMKVPYTNYRVKVLETEKGDKKPGDVLTIKKRGGPSEDGKTFYSCKYGDYMLQAGKKYIIMGNEIEKGDYVIAGNDSSQEVKAE